MQDKIEIQKNDKYQPRPYCHGLDVCTCHAGYLEPDDWCPFHGQMRENRCVKCGRFFSKENPATCSRVDR